MLLRLDPHSKSIETPVTMINATPKQLRKAADIQEKIRALQKELGQLLGGSTETTATEAPMKTKKRKWSAASRRAVGAAAKARWAKIRAGKVQQPRKKFTAAGRARLAALAKARWAKAKKAGKTTL